MRVAPGESDQLCFDRRTIARTDGLDLSVEERRILQSRSQHAVHFGIRFARPAVKLGQGTMIGDERKTMEVVFARLNLHFIEVYRARIDAHRGAGFHALVLDAQGRERSGEKRRGRFGAAPAGHRFASDVHQPVEEGAGRDHDGRRAKLRSPDGSHAAGLAVAGENFGYLVLPDVQSVGVFNASAPFADEADAVALRARTPHGRSLRSVEHAKLHGSGIRHLAHLSAQCVDLSDDLSFGNAADGRIAAHLGYFVHVHRDQHRACTHACCGTCRFASGVSGTDHNDIIMKSRIHNYAKIMISRQTADGACGGAPLRKSPSAHRK